MSLNDLELENREKSIEILKPIFIDYTDEQLVLAGERIADFLQHTYMLFKDDLNRKRAEEGRPLL